LKDIDFISDFTGSEVLSILATKDAIGDYAKATTTEGDKKVRKTEKSIKPGESPGRERNTT